MQYNTYILLIQISQNSKVHIGSLKEIKFKKGFYVYIGSAKTNLHKRIERHFKKEKKFHWHIDYLLSHDFAEVKEVWITHKYSECDIANILYTNGFTFIKKFGSSDCRCKSHLFYIGENTGDFKKITHRFNFKHLKKSKIS